MRRFLSVVLIPALVLGAAAGVNAGDNGRVVLEPHLNDLPARVTAAIEEDRLVSV